MVDVSKKYLLPCDLQGSIISGFHISVVGDWEFIQGIMKGSGQDRGKSTWICSRQLISAADDFITCQRHHWMHFGVTADVVGSYLVHW